MTSVDLKATGKGEPPEPDGPGPARLASTGSEGLAALVRRHQAMVWRYLRLLGADEPEADDLMQEVFLRVARGASTGEVLHTPASFLRAVARNLLIAARRSADRALPALEWVRSVEEYAATNPTGFDDARIDALRECREQLPGRGRQAIDLHYIEGHPYTTVAAQLGLRINGLKALLSRTRQALRECIERRTQGDSK